MAKQEKLPQYIASRLNTPMLNYKVYYMPKKEKILTGLIAFVAGGAAGLVFYGGQFRGDNGEATIATLIANVVIFCVVGLIAAKIFIPMRTEQLKAARKKELTHQFRSMLESLAVALSTGMNMTDALISVNADLKTEYSENAYIVQEVQEMISGMTNNIPIEEMLESLGERSEIEDIKNFGVVFSVSYRAGGNIKDIVRRTNSIVSEKLEVNEQIETAITSNKSQFNVMMIIPIVLVLMLRMMSSSFAEAFSTVAGVAANTIAICIFIAAYKMGEKIMDVKG